MYVENITVLLKRVKYENAGLGRCGFDAKQKIDPIITKVA